MGWKTGIVLASIFVCCILVNNGLAQSRSDFDLARDFDEDGVCDPGIHQGPWPDFCDLINEKPDNCVKVPNPDQADQDGDGIGDACDADSDGDGLIDDDACECPEAVCEPVECPEVEPNPDENDDSLSTDRDGDGLPDALEEMWGVSDPDTVDTDGDGFDDRRELLELGSDPSSTDTDGDGVCDGNGGTQANSLDCVPGPDNCILVPNPNQDDQDVDGVGDRCQGDHDGDGYSDDQDNCPLVFNPSQLNSDSHPLGDACQPFLAGSVFEDSGPGMASCQLRGATRPVGGTVYFFCFVALSLLVFRLLNGLKSKRHGNTSY